MSYANIWPHVNLALAELARERVETPAHCCQMTTWRLDIEAVRSVLLHHPGCQHATDEHLARELRRALGLCSQLAADRRCALQLVLLALDAAGRGQTSAGPDRGKKRDKALSDGPKESVSLA